MKTAPTFLLLAALLLAGCASAPIQWPSFGFGKEVADVAANPTTTAAGSMSRWGVLLLLGGSVFGAITSFRTGWGKALMFAGVLMLLLGWVFSQWWIPWLGLLTVAGYAGYKIWNWGNPKVETENPLM